MIASLPSRLPLLATLATIHLALAGCSDEGPAAPTTGPGISGRVRITARLSNTLGALTGTRVIEDADGVRVHLAKPDGTLDSTLTVDGAYEFRLSSPGNYRVKAWVSPTDTVSTGNMAFSSGSVTAEALELATSGDLVTYPNPFPTYEGLSIEMTLDADETYEVVVQTLGGEPVWSYSLASITGYQHVHWVGINNASQVVPNGPYWIRARFNGHYHYNLVFKE